MIYVCVVVYIRPIRINYVETKTEIAFSKQWYTWCSPSYWSTQVFGTEVFFMVSVYLLVLKNSCRWYTMVYLGIKYNWSTCLRDSPIFFSMSLLSSELKIPLIPLNFSPRLLPLLHQFVGLTLSSQLLTCILLSSNLFCSNSIFHGVMLPLITAAHDKYACV